MRSPARALLATVTSGPLDESVRARIIEETRGNPLALLELCRGLGTAELAGGFALPDAGDLPGRIEAQYLERLGELPEQAQRLILLAAADPVGDAAVILRGAHVLGLDIADINVAAAAGLLEFGVKVRFRHPLVRSAVYRAAAVSDRAGPWAFAVGGHPAGRSRSHDFPNSAMSDGALGLKAVEVGMVVVPDDQDRLADDAGALDGPPVAAVAGVCAVVAQDVELAGRDAVGMLAACDRRA